MSTCLIINPNAGTAEHRAVLEDAIASYPDLTCVRTSRAGEGVEAAQQALDDGHDCIAAAGGDGTINEVVNGIMQHARAGDAAVRLGVVPLGTGNDLAQTLAIPDDPADALAVLEVATTNMLDLIEIETNGATRVGINVAAGGFSGQVDEAMSSEMKADWGPLAYVLGAASVVPDLTEYDTAVAFDDEMERSMNALNVIVANGRTAAGGHRVAPFANPCDGLLDVVIVRWASVLDLAEVGARLVAGNYLDSPHVMHRKVKRLRVASQPGMLFNVDGELLTREAVTFTARPEALQVVTGPRFQAELRA